MQPAKWRLIYSKEEVGAWNMALDEAILESVGKKEQLPVLRLYAWSPPCLSIGYSQPVKDVDVDAVERNHWHLVRRPTGGRAILHTDELTYAVIAPLDEPRVAGSVLDSYRRLSQALVDALQHLGLPVQADREYPLSGKGAGGAVCFEIPSNYEITVSGKKLIGSAQARRMRGVLQHGSLPLKGDLGRITDVLVYPDAETRRLAAERVLQRATTVESVTGQPPDWKAVADTFVRAFAERLMIEFEPVEPAPGEIERARQLAVEKYASDRWTYRL